MLPLANPWTIVILGAALVGVTGSAYLKGRSDGKAVAISSQAQAEAVRMETLQLAQLAAAEEIAKIEVRHVTIKGKVEREVIEKIQYRECTHDESTLRLLNDALTGKDAGEPTDRGELPRVDAATRF